MKKSAQRRGWAARQHARLAPLGDLHRGRRAAHVRLHPAGMGRVHLDRRVAQFVGQMDGKGVERRLRRVVGEPLHPVDRRLRVGVQRQRPEDAREVDDPTGRDFRISGRSVCMSATTAKKLDSNVRRSTSGVTLDVVLNPPCPSMSASSSRTPALLTRMSSLP